MTTLKRELSPADPAFHWHSVVQARGWEQPRLDGGNGGCTPEDFCSPPRVREMEQEKLEHQREQPAAGDHGGGPAPRR